MHNTENRFSIFDQRGVCLRDPENRIGKEIREALRDGRRLFLWRVPKEKKPAPPGRLGGQFMKPYFLKRLERLKPEPGQCGVCNKTVLIHYRDEYTNIRVGICCASALHSAHNFLELASTRGGPRHPKPEEFGGMTP